MSLDNCIQIGKITKQWSNSAKEYFSNANNFEVLFPIDLDCRVKASILGLVFLIVCLIRFNTIQFMV